MTFLIEKLGRIENASIEIKPLTLFIGKNDSGKTYCASALWSMIKFVGDQPYQVSLKNVHTALKQIEGRISNLSVGEFRLILNSANLNIIHKDINQSYNKTAEGLLATAIGYDGFKDSKVFTETPHDSDSFLEIVIDVSVDQRFEQTILFEHDQSGQAQKPATQYIITYKVNSKEGFIQNYQIPIQDPGMQHVADFIGHQVGTDIAGYSMFGKPWINYRNTFYLPAARTGIMLGIDFFVSGTMERSVITNTKTKNPRPSSLPAPLNQFAASLTYPFFDPSAARPLHAILGGEYVRTKKRGEFQFTPTELGTPLPLAATSSLVTELAGFALTMGLVDASDSFVIFEEPEAHLHLAAQREIARILVALVNKGKRLLITTHSDTFLQQINNLIAINGHPKQDDLLKEFGLTPEETIDKNMVAAYDFVCKEGVTNVKPLLCTRYGFVAPSLNEVLIKLTNQTIAIRDGFEEEPNES